MKPAIRLSEEELAAEREASRRRQQAVAAEHKPMTLSDTGLRMGVPRISLGWGSYIVSMKQGIVWR